MPSASLLPCPYVFSEMNPRSAIRRMTRLRRTTTPGAFSLSVGSKRVGFCTIPASIAPWAMVSFCTGLPK